MQKVKNYMIAYREYAKSERAKLEEMKKSNMYSMDYITDQEKKMKQSMEIKRQEFQKGINEVIDGKIAGIKKPDTSSGDYQATVSNILSKVQLIGRRMTTKLLSDILAPAIEKQDNGTIEAVRSYIEGIVDYPGGDPAKRLLLEGAPRFVDQSELLQNARKEIISAMNDPGFGTGSMKADVTMHYLEQSVVFSL